jgi:MFS family permease
VTPAGLTGKPDRKEGKSMTSVHTSRRPGRLPDSAAFWGVGGTYGVFMFAAAAPAPLYGVYATRWHFSPLTLTIVFALYAVGLLLALLVTGRLSDHLGRRPVILAAITLETAAMACFIASDSTVLLCVARAVQGLATGCALGVLSAALAELSEDRAPALGAIVTSSAPMFGMAAGALGSSALVQYGPSPLRLVYWLIIAGLAVGASLVGAMREPGERRPGTLASLKPVVGVPPAARPTFVMILPSLIALWALIGFYLSLGSTLIASIEGSPNLLWGGFAVFCLCISGATSIVFLREITAQTAMLAGCVALFTGVGLTLIAIAAGSTALFLIGSVIAGTGFGLAFLGNIRAVSQVAAPAQRAGTLAVLYIVSYTMFAIPIVIAGVAETHFSAHDVALVFSGGVTALAGMGIIASLAHLRRSRRSGPPVPGAPARPAPDAGQASPAGDSAPSFPS